MVLVNRHDHELGSRITLLLLTFYYECSHYGEARTLLKRAYGLGFGDRTFESIINTFDLPAVEENVILPGFPSFMDVVDNHEEGRHALELYQNVHLEVRGLISLLN